MSSAMTMAAPVQKAAPKPRQAATAKPKQAAVASLLLQRKCACGAGTSSIGGECEECSKKKMVGLQTKLRVNEPGDPYEQEADRVAEQVLAKPAHPAVSSVPPAVQRFSGQFNGQMSAAPPSVDRTLAGPGRPLEAPLRQDMEQRFGHDFSRVRVHTDRAAEQSARDIDAHAYTVGQNIVFGADQFAPRTSEGRRLTAHELAHVVQQRSAGTQSIQRRPVKDLRWKQSLTAARYRGQLMATRIRRHGKLSAEARAKINQELAYFEGAAKEAYLHEVRPALVQTVGIEMPEMEMWKNLPTLPKSLSLLREDPLQVSDYELEKPLRDVGKAEETQLATAREAEIEALKEKTKDWLPKDREFALSLLRPLLQQTTNIDPRAVSDRIRQPILQEYRRWLEEQDKVLEKVCHEMQQIGGVGGFILRSQAAFQPNLDPCRRWFADEYSHGPSELRSLERRLNLNRANSSGKQSPAEYTYYDVFELRKKTDPYLLQQEQEASQIVSGIGAMGREPQLAGTPGLPTSPRSPKSTPELAPPTTAPTPAPVAADIPRPLSPRVAGFGKDIEPPPAPVVTDVPAPLSPRVAGFGRDIEPPPARVPTDVPQPLSPRVAGFGRDIEPSPPRSPAPEGQPITTEMPRARATPSSSSGQREVGRVPRVATGERRDQPAKAMAGKPTSGDQPKKEPAKSSGAVKGAEPKVKMGPEDLAADSKAIRQLNEWEKGNKVTGDVQGLQKRLRSKDPDTLREAREEFKEVDAKIKAGEKPHVEEFDEPRREAPESTRISTAEKSELEDSAWLKKRLPTEEDRREFMDWLKKGHKEGELGKELKPGQKETEGHEHLRPGSREAEERVTEWEREKGRRE